MNGVAIYLPIEDWNRVLAILAQAPWNVANPLIMALGSQLKTAQDGRDAHAAERPNGEDLRPPNRN